MIHNYTFLRGINQRRGLNSVQEHQHVIYSQLAFVWRVALNVHFVQDFIAVEVLKFDNLKD